MKRQDDGGRGDLTDKQWQKLQPLLPPQKAHTGQPAHDHRRMLNGILWLHRRSAPGARYSRALWQTQHNLKSILPMANYQVVATDVGKSDGTS